MTRTEHLQAIAMVLLCAVSFQMAYSSAPAGAYRIIRQDNLDASGNPTGVPGFAAGNTVYAPMGGVPADTLTAGQSSFSGGGPGPMDPGLLAPLPLGPNGARFTLFYADSFTPLGQFITSSVTRITPTLVYCDIYWLQPYELVNTLRTRSDMTYLVGYCMTGLPNGGPPGTDMYRYAMRTRISNGGTVSTSGALGGAPMSGADGGSGAGSIFLANTWSTGQPNPIGPPGGVPPNPNPDYYYPFPSGAIPVGNSQPNPPGPGIAWTPAAVNGTGLSVYVGPAPGGNSTNWTEQWHIYGLPPAVAGVTQELKPSPPSPAPPSPAVPQQPIKIFPAETTNVTYNGAAPPATISLSGSPSAWKILSIALTNLYPDCRVVVLVTNTGTGQSYVAEDTTTNALADIVLSNPGPNSQSFTFDLSKKPANSSGLFGGFFNVSGSYKVHIWYAVPFSNTGNFMTATDSLSHPGAVANTGSAAFPSAALAPAGHGAGADGNPGSIKGAGDWTSPGNPPQDWWWRDLAPNGGISFNVTFTSGVTGDIITN